VVARSIFLEIFRVFGGFLHQGRNIELDSLQEGATWIRVSTVWRGKLGIWTSDFREGFYLPRSIFLWSLALFGDLLQLGRNLGLLISSAGRAISQGGLDVTLVLLALTFIVYPAFGGLFCLIGSIL
jgi:hypothetical protein